MPHPNDKQAVRREQKRQDRRERSQVHNPAVLDAMARAALEKAQQRIEELEAEVARLSEPGTAYVPCQSHRFHSYAMTAQIGVAPPMKHVCPVCAGLATNVSGPHLVA